MIIIIKKSIHHVINVVSIILIVISICITWRQKFALLVLTTLLYPRKTLDLLLYCELCYSTSKPICNEEDTPKIFIIWHRTQHLVNLFLE